MKLVRYVPAVLVAVGLALVTVGLWFALGAAWCAVIVGVGLVVVGLLVDLGV